LPLARERFLREAEIAANLHPPAAEAVARQLSRAILEKTGGAEGN